MPNTLYDKAREAFLNGEIKWSGVGSDEIRVALVTSGYTLDVANHTNLSQIFSHFFCKRRNQYSLIIFRNGNAFIQ